VLVQVLSSKQQTRSARARISEIRCRPTESATVRETVLPVMRDSAEGPESREEKLVEALGLAWATAYTA
jgi:hypothetical protein